MRNSNTRYLVPEGLRQHVVDEDESTVLLQNVGNKMPTASESLPR
jgi:hypothetical protein